VTRFSLYPKQEHVQELKHVTVGITGVEEVDVGKLLAFHSKQRYIYKDFMEVDQQECS
jgi:hypothetical protein